MDEPTPTTDSAVTSPELLLDELERRVRLLEETVARLDDTPALEDRIVARLAERSPQLKVGASADANVALNCSQERTPPTTAATAEAAAQAKPGSADGWDVPPPKAWGGGWASWLLVDMLREFRLLVRLMLDPRYSMAWTTRITALIFFPAVLTAHMWLPLIAFWFPLMWFDITRGLTINFVNLILAFALYKALSREVRRYQDYARGPSR